jgi:hypothetical protein
VSKERQTSNPLHIENTVNSLQREALKLPQAFKTYREMLNDEIIGGGMSLIKSLINKRKYAITVPKGASKQEEKLIAALNKSLDSLEGMTKPQLLNYILSELDYGHSIFEQVMKREEGTMVFSTFSPIHPTNVKKYVFERNTLKKLELSPATNDGLLIQNAVGETELAGSKVLLFRVNADLDNPLGLSLLNRCYKPYKSRDIVQEYELIGVAKNLSGVLKIKAPSDYINAYYNDPQSENAKYLEEMMDTAEQLHAGTTSLCLVASDLSEGGQSLFDITTVGNTSGTQFDSNSIIKRYESNMLMTLFTDIMSLGQAGGGSFALSDSKTNVLALVIESLCEGISATFKQAVRAAYSMNTIKPNGEYPTLEFEAVENLDFDSFSRGFQRLVKDGVIEIDEELESWIRERIKAPKKDATTTRKAVVSKGSTDDTQDTERDDKEA